MSNPHFETVTTWQAARPSLAFEPRVPTYLGGMPLAALRIHVRDHKKRELPVERRTLEAHYDRFVVSQCRKGAAEARRAVVEVSYGRNAVEARVGGHEARLYELGPEPPPDDVDGRSPAVVVWYDGEMLYLIASVEMNAADLMPIAASMYDPRVDR